MRQWETVSRRVILNHSQYLRVESHDIMLPNGELILDWPWIITPEFVTIIVITAKAEFVLFRQTKYSIDGVGLAPIGGYIEQGELPLQAAKRELYEEVGYTADSWTHLGSYPVDGNRGAGTAHLYLAQDAVHSAAGDTSRVSDDLEEQELVFFKRDEVVNALKNKEFKVLPWVAAVALSLQYIE